ncbi:mitogen-activated protein kinase 10-like protein isoform X1 [Cinnamomum micranthum f. kanehirae]|uniref:Mitogen-activated protein kinase 10-like protein isoform X1 n=1 Tax=Cinnamomum micranthum f. kanehirae TaxID=337451 RepID=A0A443P6E3_9MAGN|nr:mitogen-activated protein kinase 10-like protein isoform X1 [Cinnamomum micranthum f. kanehirae]
MGTTLQQRVLHSGGVSEPPSTDEVGKISSAGLGKSRLRERRADFVTSWIRTRPLIGGFGPGLITDSDHLGLTRHCEPSHLGLTRQSEANMEFYTQYRDANRFMILKDIGKGTYGVVCSAIDTYTGQKVAIKRVCNIFKHISDATQILREIKLLGLLCHPDIVEIKHILLPCSRTGFDDIYIVFELMESDLRQFIKTNDELTKQHHRVFLYQMLLAMKYIHSAGLELELSLWGEIPKYPEIMFNYGTILVTSSAERISATAPAR